MVIQLLDSVKLANAPELAAIYWRPRPRIKRHNVWSLLRGGDRPTGIAAYRPKISDLVKSFGRRQAYKRAEERICGPQGRSTTIEAYCIRCSLPVRRNTTDAPELGFIDTEFFLGGNMSQLRTAVCSGSRGEGSSLRICYWLQRENRYSAMASSHRSAISMATSKAMTARTRSAFAMGI